MHFIQLIKFRPVNTRWFAIDKPRPANTGNNGCSIINEIATLLF